MERRLCALFVDNAFDFAVVSAAQSAVRARLDGETPVPILSDGKLSAAFPRILEHYGVRTVRLSDIVKGEHPRARARALLTGHADNPVSVSADASLPQLGAALARALAESRPLDLEGDGSEISWPESGGRAGHRLAVRADSRNLLPAVVYAHVTGKELQVVRDWSELAADGGRAALASLTVVDDYKGFTKPLIETLVGWSHDPERGFPLGLMTAYSEYEFSALVWRLQAHSWFLAGGKRLDVPPAGQVIPTKTMSPLQFYALHGHGNERHLKHSARDTVSHEGSEILCGAFDAAVRRHSLSFDCDIECPYVAMRVRTSDIPAHNLVILSCDAVTVGDSVVPEELTVALNCLNGWATSMIGPYKHAMIHDRMLALTDSLFRSGYTLGEITLRMNGAGRPHELHDNPYILLGDPEAVACPWVDRAQPLVESGSRDGSEVLTLSRISGYVAEVPVAAAAAPGLWGVESDQEAASTTLFTFCNLPREKAPRLVLFSGAELPATISVRVAPVSRLAPAELARYAKTLRAISHLASQGFSAEVVHNVEKQLHDSIRFVIWYPSEIGLLATGSEVEHIKQQLGSMLVTARQQILSDIIGKMATGPVWISHLYCGEFPQVSKVPPQEKPVTCQFCRGNITSWLYQNPVTDLPERHVLICSRCGIVADHPVPKRIDVAFDVERLPGGKGGEHGFNHTQGLTVTNRGDSAVALTLFLQCNGWEKQGIISDPLFHDIELQPGESQRLTVGFEMEPTEAGDDLLAMQAFVLTEHFEMYSFVWKFPIRRRYPVAEQPALHR